MVTIAHNPATNQESFYNWEYFPNWRTSRFSYTTYYGYHSAYLPCYEAAFTGALALFAGTFGRAYNTCTKAGLNIYVALLAETGMGKEAAYKTASKIITAALQNRDIILEAGTITPDFASAQGMVQHLARMQFPSCVNFIDEYGMYLQRLNTQNLKDVVSLQLRRQWLSAYSFSDFGNMMPGIGYSDANKIVNNIEWPALSLCGWSTPDNLYRGIDETNITDGMLPRTVFIHHTGKRPSDNKNQIALPKDLLDWYVKAAQFAKETERNNRVIYVMPDDDASYQLQCFSEYCTNIINDAKDPIIKLLYNHAHLNVLKIASLFAIGDNYQYPAMSPDHVIYAIDVIRHSIEGITKRFETGEVGEHVGPDIQSEQQKVVLKSIQEYIKTPWSNQFGKTYKVTAEQKSNNIISWQWFNSRVRTLKEFRKTYDSQKSLITCLQGLVDAGHLIQLTTLKGAAKAFQILPEGMVIATPSKMSAEQTKARFNFFG